MAKRLTWRSPGGCWGIEGVDLAALPRPVYGALYKLKDLEDLFERAAAPGADLSGDRELAWEEITRLAGGQPCR